MSATTDNSTTDPDVHDLRYRLGRVEHARRRWMLLTFALMGLLLLTCLGGTIPTVSWLMTGPAQASAKNRAKEERERMEKQQLQYQQMMIDAQFQQQKAEAARLEAEAELKKARDELKAREEKEKK